MEESNWKPHYKMIVKRLFDQKCKSMIQQNRELYQQSTEKVSKPCNRCGFSNKYERCEKCAYSSFVASVKPDDIQRYIQQHKDNLLEFIHLKELKTAHQKQINKKLSDLVGPKSEKKSQTGSTPAAGGKRGRDMEPEESEEVLVPNAKRRNMEIVAE